MDPLSIAASSLGLAGAIAKAVMSITEFANHAAEAKEDLENMSKELQATAAMLDPITRVLYQGQIASAPGDFIAQIHAILEGCTVVVARVEENVRKYQREGMWTRTKWVLFGQDDMKKLRQSLEAYKLALAIGLQVVSLTAQGSIKDDTGAIREYVAVIKSNTDEILARVSKIRETRRENTSKVEQWIEDMMKLSSYAETTYQETVSDPIDRPEPPTTPPVQVADDEQLGAADRGLGSSMAGGADHRPRNLVPSPSSTPRRDSDRVLRSRVHSSPPIVVSVHQAMDITHVAWKMGLMAPKLIANWPSAPWSKDVGVPTRISYDERGNVASWGFGCLDDKGEVHRYFDVYQAFEDNLQQDRTRRPSGTPASTADAQRFASDFLCQVYKHVRREITSSLGLDGPGEWERASIRFRFPKVTGPEDLFAGIIRDAGFGRDGPPHELDLSASETVGMVKGMLDQVGMPITPKDVIMWVCATDSETEVNLLEAPEPGEQWNYLGRPGTHRSPSGESYLDDAFEKMVQGRIDIGGDRIPSGLLPGPAARTARLYEWQTSKSRFGDPKHRKTHYIYRIPGWSEQISLEDVGIIGGCIKFTHDEVRSIFDQQVERIKKATQEQLDWLEANGYADSTPIVVMFGTLGDSPYIQDQLRVYLKTLKGFNNPRARLPLVTPSAPDWTIIARGLCLEQGEIGRLDQAPPHGTSVALANYGVLDRHSRHGPDKIHWLVKKGDAVNPTDPLIAPLNLSIAGRGAVPKNGYYEFWIVTCQDDRGSLPTSVTDHVAGVVLLFKVARALPNLTWWDQARAPSKYQSRWRKLLEWHHLTDSYLRIILELPHIEYEIWDRGKRLQSGSTQLVNLVK